MYEEVKVSRTQVKPILAVSFPDYRGRKIKVRFSPTVRFYDTNWSGGTRNEYHVVKVDGNARLRVPAPWDNMVEGTQVELSPDVLVVCHTIFCGKDLGITIYAHPQYAPKWLTA